LPTAISKAKRCAQFNKNNGKKKTKSFSTYNGRRVIRYYKKQIQNIVIREFRPDYGIDLVIELF
jgi:hypothetical protein